jgi:hypothetical protein
MTFYHAVTIEPDFLRPNPNGPMDSDRAVAWATFMAFQRALHQGDVPQNVDEITRQGHRVTVRLECYRPEPHAEAAV